MASPQVPSPRRAQYAAMQPMEPANVSLLQRSPSPPKTRTEEEEPPPSPNSTSHPRLPSHNDLVRPLPVHLQRTMRPEDFRGMIFKEDSEKAAHRSFVRQLVDGHMRIPVRHPRREGYDLMQMSIDAHLTVLSWSPASSSGGGIRPSQASASQSLDLDEVVSVVPWTHKMPTKKPTAAELTMAAQGGCWYFGVCVAYSKHRPLQLMLLCRNAAEQDQLVLSLRTLIRNALHRRSSLRITEAARIAQLGPTFAHLMAPTRQPLPIQHAPMLVRR